MGDVHISDFYRSGQLQNILDTIRKECQKMGQYENKTMNKLLPDAVNKGYEIAGDTFDIHLGHLNKKAVESVVRDKWTEKSFSDRIWDNKAKLIDQLNDKLLTGLSTGQSPYKIATELSKSLNVGKNVAQRLATTEYMNKLNMGQKKAYEEAGYDEVRWHAVEDERKCAVCGKLHDTKFKLNEAPHAPIHPRCRCILLPVIDEMEESGTTKAIEFPMSSFKQIAPIRDKKEQYNFDLDLTNHIISKITPEKVRELIDLSKKTDDNDTSFDNPYMREIYKIAHEKGFDALPIEVSELPDELNKLYRVTSRIEQFEKGPLEYSTRNSSSFGHGIYFGNGMTSMRQHYQPGMSLIEAGIKKDTKLVEPSYLQEALTKIILNNKEMFGDVISNDRIVGKKDKIYDMIALENNVDGFYSYFNKYVVMLNRGAIIYHVKNFEI